jgi:hypothetical protein
MAYKWRVAVALGLSLAACGKASQESSLNVYGGQETNEYPGVIRFLVDLDSGRFCTGVVVSETTALVAGHCIKNMTLLDQIYAERPQQSGPAIKSSKIYFWTSMGNMELLNEETIARDLAVVEFADAPFKRLGADAYVKIAPQVLSGSPLAAGTPVKMVGYGAAELGNTKGARDSEGVKRMGTNTVAEAKAGSYLIKSKISEAKEPGHAFAADGDAGAPLFDTAGNLVGIGAGSMLVDANGNATKPVEDERGYLSHSLEGAESALNAFVDLSSPESRKLLAWAAWNGRPGQGHVVIPGIEPQAEVTLSEEDVSWTRLNNKDSSGTWVAMTGGGGFAAPAQSLALQGLARGCNPPVSYEKYSSDLSAAKQFQEDWRNRRTRFHVGGASDGYDGYGLQGMISSCTQSPSYDSFNQQLQRADQIRDSWSSYSRARQSGRPAEVPENLKFIFDSPSSGMPAGDSSGFGGPW